MKERGGKAEYIVLDQGKTDTTAAFWDALGGKGTISEDDLIEQESENKLYRIGDETEKKKIRLIQERGLPPKELLNTQHTYVLDAKSEIYVWVGHNSKLYQRKLAVWVAKKLAKKSTSNNAMGVYL